MENRLFFKRKKLLILLAIILGSLCFSACLSVSSQTADLKKAKKDKSLTVAEKYFKRLEKRLVKDKLFLSDEEALAQKEIYFDQLYQALLASSEEAPELSLLSEKLLGASYSLGIHAIDRGDLKGAAEFLDEISIMRNILPRPFPPSVEKVYKKARGNLLIFEKLAVERELSTSNNILLKLDNIWEEISKDKEISETAQPTIKDMEQREAIHSLWKDYLNLIWNSRYASVLLVEYHSNYYKYSKRFDLSTFPSKPISMSFIAGDGFTMGSPLPSDPAEEKPAHTIYLNSFFMGQFEVTQELYQSVTNQNNSFKSNDPRAPVEDVNWYDAILFCNLLSQKYGLEPCYDLATKECDFSANGFRLPTEAEWEFAAKGGIKRDNLLYAGGDNIDQLAWYHKNSDNITKPVGQKSPNQLNLYDMTGNVWEWCNDWFNMYDTRGDTEFNPTGPKEGVVKVRRGGSWLSEAIRCRNTSRIFFTPGVGYYSIGFRVVRNSDNISHIDDKNINNKNINDDRNDKDGKRIR